MEAGNVLWLIKDYEKGKTPNVKEDLNDVWSEIYTEYCDLTNDNDSFRYYKLSMRLIYLETRVYFASNIILQMASRSMDEKTAKEYIESLREWDVKYTKDKIDLDELEKAQRQIKLSKNEISIKRKQIDELRGDGEKTPFEKQVVLAEQALGRNQINPKKTSVKKWVYMMDFIRESNIQKSKLNGK